MKTILALAAFLFLASTVAFAEPSEKTGTLRHVVCIKFKAGTDEADIKKVENAFRDLKNKIPGIVSLEWGTNVSPEKHAKGFTHCFILGFKSDKDRDAYLVHPEHKKFGKILGPVMDDVFVIDFWAKE
jgi:hypothetical protein